MYSIAYADPTFFYKSRTPEGVFLSPGMAKLIVGTKPTDHEGTHDETYEVSFDDVTEEYCRFEEGV